MRPLGDITLYYFGNVLNDNGAKSDFRMHVNYICDFYHKMLKGYKPPKTSRICIHANKEKNFDLPDYNGAICHIACAINEERYINSSKEEKNNYILDLVHSCCFELSDRFNWDRNVFEAAYIEVKNKNFYFELNFPEKKSRDRKKSAFVQISKTEQHATLYLVFMVGDSPQKIKLFEKRNWYWYDSIYELASNSKWLDNSTFGVHNKKNDRFSYYSLHDEVIIGNINFQETDF